MIWACAQLYSQMLWKVNEATVPAFSTTKGKDKKKSWRNKVLSSSLSHFQVAQPGEMALNKIYHSETKSWLEPPDPYHKANIHEMKLKHKIFTVQWQGDHLYYLFLP